jgi:hypothetical protein
MRLSRIFLTTIFGASIALNAIAQSDVCNALLSDGMFNKSTTIGAWNNYQHVVSLYCTEEASSFSKAQGLSLNGVVPIEGILASLGFSANESGYSDMKKKLCFSNDSLYSQEGWLDQRISTASQLIVDGYVKCRGLLAEGVFQRIEGESRDAPDFAWHIENKLSTHQTVMVKPSIPNNIICKSEDGKIIKAGTAFPLLHEGLLFNCIRQNCDSSLLVLSSTFAANPSILRLPAFLPTPPPPPPKKHFAEDAESMNQMWSRVIPGTTAGETCRLINTTDQWNCHYDNADCQRLCNHDLQPLSPIVTVVGNVVSSNDFDHGNYGDNAGVCKYTFECTFPNTIENPPPRPAYCQK